jgi:hypothetical protein
MQKKLIRSIAKINSPNLSKHNFRWQSETFLPLCRSARNPLSFNALISKAELVNTAKCDVSAPYRGYKFNFLKLR